MLQAAYYSTPAWATGILYGALAYIAASAIVRYAIHHHRMHRALMANGHSGICIHREILADRLTDLEGFGWLAAKLDTLGSVSGARADLGDLLETIAAAGPKGASLEMLQQATEIRHLPMHIEAQLGEEHDAWPSN